MADLSITAASNSPAGSESSISTDDFHRAIQGILRTTNAKGSDIASATTTDIGAATAEFIDVTGTTAITGLGTIAAGIVRTVRFTGALTLTHNGTSLILPGGANITTAANDTAIFRSLGSGNWLCIEYKRQSGFPVVLGGTAPADISVPDEVYGSGWNGSLEVPTKNAVYDKIEAIQQKAFGSFTRDITTASGTQVVTGVGFTPTKVNFKMVLSSGAGPNMSIGDDVSSSRNCLFDSGSGNYSCSNSFSIYSYGAAGANLYQGLITAFSGDGFTITWTKTGTPTGTITIFYMAEA
jgi:hypothetical protein